MADKAKSVVGLDEENDIQNYWLLAKHPDGGQEYATVSQIENFYPTSKTDFDSRKKYVIRTSHWSGGEAVSRMKVYILRIEESIPKLELSLASKRPSVPVLCPRDSDYLTSEAELEQRKLVKEREDPAALDLLKRKAADNELSEISKFLGKRKLQIGSKDQKSSTESCGRSSEISSKKSSCSTSSLGSRESVGTISGTSRVTTHSSKRKSEDNSTSASENSGNKKATVIKTSTQKIKQPTSSNSISKSGKESLFKNLASVDRSNVESHVTTLKQKQQPPPFSCHKKQANLSNTSAKSINSNSDLKKSFKMTPKGESKVQKMSSFDSSLVDNSSESSDGQRSEIVVSQSDGTVTILSHNDIISEKDSRIQELEKTLDHYKRLAAAPNDNQAIIDILLAIQEKLGTVDRRVEAVETKVASVDSRVEGVETKIGGVDRKVEGVEAALHQHGIKLLARQPANTAVALASGLCDASTSSTPSSAGALRVIDGSKVDLGEGVRCSLTAFKTMEVATDLNVWCNALLRGVFGEKAKFYRYRLQSKSCPGLKPFPAKFVNVAQILYRQFLLRNGHKSASNHKAVAAVMARLSRKARDLAGRRSASSASKRREETIAITADNEASFLLDPETGLLVPEANLEILTEVSNREEELEEEEKSDDYEDGTKKREEDCQEDTEEDEDEKEDEEDECYDREDSD